MRRTLTIAGLKAMSGPASILADTSVVPLAMTRKAAKQRSTVAVAAAVSAAAAAAGLRLVQEDLVAPEAVGRTGLTVRTAFRTAFSVLVAAAAAAAAAEMAAPYQPISVTTMTP